MSPRTKLSPSPDLPSTIDGLYETAAVRGLFDEMSATYGLVNLVASFGFAARWRHQVVERMPVADASHIIDLMSGMNELCRSIAPNAKNSLSLSAFDISPEMIRRGHRNWAFGVQTHLADVLTWDFTPDSADLVLSSFGLKTFSPRQQSELARRVARLLRPGGSFSFVEISVPSSKWLRGPYMFYLNHVIPWIGRLFLGNPENYRLLGVYTTAFSNCGHFAECLREAGLHVEFVNYFFGCATGVRGTKPAR